MELINDKKNLNSFSFNKFKDYHCNKIISKRFYETQ